MSTEGTEGGANKGAELANELQSRVKSLDLQDKLSFGGAAAYVVLALLGWFEVSMNFLGVSRSESYNGLELDTGKLAWACALLLAVWHIVPQLRQFAAEKIQEPVRSLLPLILGAIVFLLGPIYFLVKGPETPDLPAEAAAAGFKAGRTFFFWLAFLAAAAAGGGPAWKKFGTSDAA